MIFSINQLARIRADQGRLQQAQKLYDQAVALDPYYIEATTNKGLIYKRSGPGCMDLAAHNARRYAARKIDRSEQE